MRTFLFLLSVLAAQAPPLSEIVSKDGSIQPLKIFDVGLAPRHTPEMTSLDQYHFD
jgi:hypothetical protein